MSKPKDGPKMTRLTATIPEEVADEFRKYCERQRRSMSAQITLLIEQAMEEQHDHKPA